MTIKIHFQIIILGFVFFFGSSPINIYAQTPDSIPIVKKEVVPELPGDEVEVIKNFKARLAETKRLSILPENPVFERTTIPYSYEVNVRGLSLDYLPAVIRPIAMKPEPKVKAYNTWLKFGYGYPHYSVASLNGAYQVTENLRVGLNYAHQAAKHKKRNPAFFYEHVGDVYGIYRVSELMEVKASFDLDLDKRALVNRGVASDLDYRAVNRYRGGLRFSTAEDNTRNFSYNLNTAFSNAGILDLDESESWFRIQGQVKNRFNAVVGGLDLDYNFLNYTGDTSSLNSFRVLPTISYHQSRWNLAAGLHVLFENGQAFYLPEASFTTEILPQYLIFKAFAHSDIRLNSWHNTLHVNPYIQSLSALSNEKIITYGVNLSGKIDRWNYSGELGYKHGIDVLSYSQIETMDSDEPIYWNTTAHIANSLHAEIIGGFELNENIDINTEFLYQNWKDTSGVDLEGLYDVSLTIGSDLKFVQQKLTISPKVFWIGNIATTVEDADRHFVDVGLDVSYRIHKNASAFVESKNILNRKNERWTNYPALGIFVAGGVQVRF